MPVSRGNARDFGVRGTYVAIDEAPGILLKATQGILDGWAIINQTAAVAYVQVFDVAALASVTIGTTAADAVIPLAANGVYHISSVGMPFLNGIAVFSTTTATGGTGAAVAGTFFWL